MTREQAIKVLRPILDSFVDYANLTMKVEDDKTVDALEMAIEALKQPEIITCGECRWYGRANKQRFYRGMDCLQRRMNTVVPDKDFCSKAERAERRTNE